ncbi:hypothetical protein C1645_813198 [Glomus cerebriforme]|uniref:Uncharacterized protein n=1 Tax=Glomus cerebriforme TaxID=658196 RepID=A0A397TNT9_9GLOM|nr:hypothetical protein C1645_813198 [Glomus cerebriforme]
MPYELVYGDKPHDSCRNNHIVTKSITTEKSLQNQYEVIHLENKEMKHLANIGDLVRISVPKIDCFGIDKPTLLCKVLKKINDQYRLSSQFGIINIFYSYEEIDPLGVKYFSEFETIPTNTITVREAVHLQNVGLITGIICNCKENCNSKKCNCRKMRNNYRRRCHDSHHCQNKYKDN